MRIKPIIFFLLSLLSFKLFGMDSAPNFKDIFAADIYCINDVELKTPVGEIEKKFLEIKKSYVSIKKTCNWEKTLKNYQDHNEKRKSVKYISFGANCVASLVVAWWYWPAAATWTLIAKTAGMSAVKTIIAGYSISEIAPDLLIGSEIKHEEINKLEHQIAYWMDGLLYEPIYKCECEYLTKKYKDFVPKDVQRQIEKVLLESRNPASQVDTKSFVEEALKLPVNCKFLEVANVPTELQNLDESILISLKQIMIDIVRCATLASRPHEKNAKMRHVAVLIGKKSCDKSVAEYIADAYGLSYHNFMPASCFEEDIYGTSRYDKVAKKGELIKIFTNNNENHQNGVLEINFDYMCNLLNNPCAPIIKIIKSQEFHNNFFDLDIDLRKLHIFISSHGDDPGRCEKLKDLAKDLSIQILDLKSKSSI